MQKEIKTTGQLREVIAQAINDVANGTMTIDNATAIHKLARNISDSLYSETKIAMFSNQIGVDIHKMGDLPIGRSHDDS